MLLIASLAGAAPRGRLPRLRLWRAGRWATATAGAVTTAGLLIIGDRASRGTSV